MASFKDAAGKVWPVVIDVGTLKRCRAAGFDLPKKMEDLRKFHLEDMEDPERFAELLWNLCLPDKADPPLTAEAFHARLDGDVLFQATIAINEAVVDFFPKASPAQKTATKAAMHREIGRREKESIDTLDSWSGASPSPEPPASATPPPTPSENSSGKPPADGTSSRPS